jgi:hypothetical protein
MARSRYQNIHNILSDQATQAVASTVAIDIEHDALEIQKRFRAWLYTNVLNNKPSKLEKLFGAAGFIIGAVSTSSTYPLGSDFAVTLAGDAEGAGVEFFKIFCGMSALIPTAALVGLPSYSEFQKLAAYLQKKPQLPIVQDRAALKKNFMIAAHVLASFTGVPFYSLLRPYFANIPFLNVAIPLTALVSSYCATISVERDLIEKYFIRTRKEDEDIKFTRNNLENKIDAALASLAKLKDEKITKLHNDLLEILKQTPEKAAINGMKKIFETCLHRADNATEPSGRHTHWKKRIIDISSLTFGVISTFVFYPPATETSELFFNTLGFPENKFQNFLNNFVGVMSVVPNAIFDAMYAKYDTDRIYDAWVSGQRIPGLKTFIAHTIAALSSTPSAYLAIAESNSAFEIAGVAPVFIGSMLARAMAFDDLLSYAINSFKKNSVQIKRQNFVTILENFRRGVRLLPPDILESLNNSLHNLPQEEQE